MSEKFIFLFQGLFVVFVWSASKIIMKMGLEVIPPYIFAAAIQVVALLAIGVYYLFKDKTKRITPTREEIYLMVLGGLVAFAGAKIFSIIGLQYVTGATAGLIATTVTVFAVIIAALVLKERPKIWQYAGILLILVGTYVFLSQDIITGSMFGILLLLVAEMAFAFNNVIVRLLSRRPEDIALLTNLVGNIVGTMVLLPLGLIVDGVPTKIWTWPVIALVIIVGLIFGFSGFLWARLLDKLKVLEVSVLSNTMIIQVAILSVIFLNESMTWYNVAGGLLVLIGAFVTDQKVILHNDPRFEHG